MSYDYGIQFPSCFCKAGFQKMTNGSESTQHEKRPHVLQTDISGKSIEEASHNKSIKVLHKLDAYSIACSECV